MEYFAGIDVSLEQSSVCVVDAAGKIIREAKVASEPDYQSNRASHDTYMLPAAKTTDKPEMMMATLSLSMLLFF